MGKALTREDLLYILNSVFTLSRVENNAFILQEDGLYVEDYHLHSDIETLHVPTPTVHEIISNLSTNELGQLLYNGNPASMAVSEDEDNSLEIRADGMYVKLIPTEVMNHIDDGVIHVDQTDRDRWDDSLQNAKDYTDSEINKLVIQRIRFVNDVPEVDQADPLTIYLSIDEDTAEDITMSMLVGDQFKHLNLTKKTLRKYYTKTETDDKFLTKTDAESIYVSKQGFDDQYKLDHGHLVGKNNKFLSDRANNGLRVEEDGGLFFPDLNAEIHSLQIAAAFSKTNLLEEELDAPGKYTMKDDINRYNLILIEYYYKPEDADMINTDPSIGGYAKTAIVDPDTMEFLKVQGIDYCLEVGYGISNLNTKINMTGDKITVNYYHGICIYKITGIGKLEPTPVPEEPEEEPEPQEPEEENGGES